MSFRHFCAALTAALTSSMALLNSAHAFTPETITVEESIPPGANVLINQAEWAAASKIHVYGQESLHYKGSVSVGLTSQILLSHDQATLFTLSDYLKRFTYGPAESVVQIFDLATLTEKQEIIVPTKAVKAIGMSQLLEQSSDGRYLYVQNATPATSVTVVDLETSTVVSEIPIPGCYGIIPAMEGHRFSTLCGTGVLKSYVLDGSEYQTFQSDTIFNPDQDPLYVQAERRKDGTLIIPAYSGTLYLIDDSKPAPSLVKTLDITRDVGGNWAPGGYEVISYNAAHDVVFMIVHPDAHDGSHKDPSAEIWSYSLGTEKLIARSKAEGLIAIETSQGNTPTLFGTHDEEESIVRYTLDAPQSLRFKEAGSDGKAGWATSLRVTGGES